MVPSDPNGITFSLGSFLQVSFNTVRAWTNFAAKGYPGFGVGAWTQEDPVYLKIYKVNL